MKSSSPSRGRWILAIGAIIMAGSCFLQWWQIGGNGPDELSKLTGNGFNAMTGSVFVMFLASVASLFLVTLPFASEKPVAVDHPLSYLLLLGFGLAGYVWAVVNLARQSLVPFPPQQGLGFWVAIIGLVLFARGIFEMHEERQTRLY
jgi:hypothetical protein